MGKRRANSGRDKVILEASQVSLQRLQEGRCILCDEIRPLTEEHIWANWLKKYLPHIDDSMTFESIVNGVSKKEVVDKGYLDSSLKVLCADCNNRWGSKLHTNTIPLLTRLFAGEWSSFSKHERTKLTCWAFLFTAVREYLHPELIAVMPAVRKQFRLHAVPPKGFHLWMAPIVTADGVLATWQRALATHLRTGELKVNTKITTFILPSLVFCAIYTNNEWCEAPQSSIDGAASMLKSLGYVRMWPTSQPIPSEKPPAQGDDGYRNTLPLVELAMREPSPILAPGALQFDVSPDQDGFRRARITAFG